MPLQVKGCDAELQDLKSFHRKRGICVAHSKASVFVRNDQRTRFCQRCGCFHLLRRFDGELRCAAPTCCWLCQITAAMLLLTPEQTVAPRQPGSATLDHASQDTCLLKQM